MLAGDLLGALLFLYALKAGHPLDFRSKVATKVTLPSQGPSRVVTGDSPLPQSSNNMVSKKIPASWLGVKRRPSKKCIADLTPYDVKSSRRSLMYASSRNRITFCSNRTDRPEL